jgi:hypothetical protein
MATETAMPEESAIAAVRVDPDDGLTVPHRLPQNVGAEIGVRA